MEKKSRQSSARGTAYLKGRRYSSALVRFVMFCGFLVVYSGRKKREETLVAMFFTRQEIEKKFKVCAAAA